MLCEPLFGVVEPVPVFVNDALRVATDNVGGAGRHHYLGARHTGGPDPVDDDFQVFYLLARYLERVDERG